MIYDYEIVNDAVSLVGKLKYVFGGDNIKGGEGDCSDFTQHVFSLNGLSIGGDTSAQYTLGTPVPRESLVPSDLVFFKDTYKSGKVDGVSHVGIYVGDNKFVHLCNSGCIISSLDDGYYESHYLGGRRYKGIVYTDESSIILNVNEAQKTEGNEETENSIGLQWWGDIVKVIIIVLLVIGGVAFLALAVGGNISAGFKNISLKGAIDNNE